MTESPCSPVSTTDLEDIERATIQRVFEQVNGDKALSGQDAGHQSRDALPQAEAVQHRIQSGWNEFLQPHPSVSRIYRY